MSPESTAMGIDSVKHRALIRKLDWHIVPFLIVLYLFSFLDRGATHNITPPSKLISYERLFRMIY